MNKNLPFPQNLDSPSEQVKVLFSPEGLQSPEGNFQGEPDVSVIVPVYNGQATIRRCLDSLVHLDYPKEKLEIIVVDNNSTDDSRRIIERYPVVYVFEERRSRPRARNRGIEVAHGEIICFLDADCSARPDWVKNLIKGFDQEKIGACGGKILAYQPNTWVEKYLNYSSSNFRNILKETPFAGPYIDTANSAYPQKIFREIGLFDETLEYNEDVDISWRICLNEHQLKYVPEATVYREYPGNLVNFCKRFFKSGYYAMTVTQKYKWLESQPATLELWIDTICEFCRFMKTPLNNLFRGKYKWQRVFALFDGVRSIAFFCGLGYHLLQINIGKKKKIQPSSFLSENKTISWGTKKETMVFNLENDYYSNLNETASIIWEMFRAGKSVNEIIDSISQEYQVSKEDIEADILQFVNILKKTPLETNYYE